MSNFLKSNPKSLVEAKEKSIKLEGKFNNFSDLITAENEIENGYGFTTECKKRLEEFDKIVDSKLSDVEKVKRMTKLRFDLKNYMDGYFNQKTMKIDSILEKIKKDFIKKSKEFSK